MLREFREFILPGLVVYGVGLSLVLTTNDLVSLDSIAERDQGQASGVSATAEQFGGALGHRRALLDLPRHLPGSDDRLAPDLTERTGTILKDTLQTAEASGLKVPSADPALLRYLEAAQDASNQGYVVTFITVAVLAIIAGGLVAWLVRKPKSAV